MGETKIYVLPKVEFNDILKRNKIDDNNVEEFVGYGFICINDTSGDYYHKPTFMLEHKNVINLFFDDVENDLELSPTNRHVTRAFTEKQAQQVLGFLKENKDVKTLFVHCAGGISRSGAVGRFALDYLHGDKEFFKQTNRHILPNPKVTMLLNEQWRKS